jgi:geranylgeranyl reductase family protein
MDSCDVLIVGGGPAGSTCAWKLRRAGLDVLVLDKRKFPRDKVCGGWITPAVLEELEIDAREYSRGRVFQPITGFRTCRMGDELVETRYKKPVSYGIRRYEFDHYLLQRSGARVLEGVPFTGLERNSDLWIANGSIRTPLVIGAGGHFCPLARFLGAKVGQEAIVAAQELELSMIEAQRAECAVQAEVPELYFCSDLKGYGWCFRKADILNVGLGRLDSHQLSAHVTRFIDFLKRAARIPRDFPETLHGHAYLLYGSTPRKIVGDGILLVGDAAGLAYWQSGEGIRPAIESGILAAQTILGAAGRYAKQELEGYRALLTARFGKVERDWATKIAQLVPNRLAGFLGGTLMATSWFARHIVLDRWFLHSHEPALTC